MMPPSRNASPIELANSPIVNGQPRSLSTTIVLAMHGTNSVIVTMATSSCADDRFIVKKPAAPKSRRTKPITNAAAA